MNIIQQKQQRPGTIINTIQMIALSQNYDQYLQISEQDIIRSLKEKFPQLEIEQRRCIRQKQFYTVLKKICQNYLQLAGFLSNYKETPIQDSSNIKNQAGSQQPRRKVTRSVFAMRNQKTQEQLRKDQIFVRVIPRSQSCIQFMLKNRNFPRIQCKLSCNQHLEYLINFLTDKWLRKVGLGYQIVLYPDASKYLRKIQNQQRSEVVHQPLNNYFMFTDIMSACGITQNGCLNLFYDIIELRKEKRKNGRVTINEKEQIKQKYQANFTPEKQKEKFPKRQEFMSFQKKLEQNAQNILQSHEDISMGHPRQISLKIPSLKPHENTHNIDESSLFGSLGYQHYRSNSLGGNFFINSNTFLNAGGLSINDDEQEVKAGNQKLQNIRNYISMVQKEVDVQKKEPNDRDENSLQKEDVILKKEVKTVVITKKKNLQ